MPKNSTPPVPEQPASEAAAETAPASESTEAAAAKPAAKSKATAAAKAPKAAEPAAPELAQPTAAEPAPAASAAPPAPETPAAPAPEAATASPAAPAPAADIDDTGTAEFGRDVAQVGRGFFSALFDVSFRTFITRRLAGIFYIVGLIGIAIGFLVYFISGIVRGISLVAAPSALSGHVGAGIALLLATVILVPLASLFAIIVLRFIIEAVVALIAIAENTERTAQHTKR